MNQIPGATPAEPPAQTQAPSQPQQPGPEGPPPADAAPAVPTGFGSRGRARRRLRFLRKARELAYRDLGGLVYNLHRFGQRNDPLVLDKLNTLGHIDRELRALEGSLSQQSPVTVLREAGITACPRCAAIHSSEDHFCPNCGIAMGRNADLPIAGAAAPAPAPSTPAPAPSATTPPQPPAPFQPPAPVQPPAPAPVQTAAPFAAPQQPAAPSPAPAQPQVTPGSTPAPRPAAGRSPTPPTRPESGAPADQGKPPGGEELTEILPPPAPGT